MADTSAPGDSLPGDEAEIAAALFDLAHAPQQEQTAAPARPNGQTAQQRRNQHESPLPRKRPRKPSRSLASYDLSDIDDDAFLEIDDEWDAEDEYLARRNGVTLNRRRKTGKSQRIETNGKHEHALRVPQKLPGSPRFKPGANHVAISHFIRWHRQGGASQASAALPPAERPQLNGYEAGVIPPPQQSLLPSGYGAYASAMEELMRAFGGAPPQTMIPRPPAASPAAFNHTGPPAMQSQPQQPSYSQPRPNVTELLRQLVARQQAAMAQQQQSQHRSASHATLLQALGQAYSQGQMHAQMNPRPSAPSMPSTAGVRPASNSLPPSLANILNSAMMNHLAAQRTSMAQQSAPVPRALLQAAVASRLGQAAAAAARPRFAPPTQAPVQIQHRAQPTSTAAMQSLAPTQEATSAQQQDFITVLRQLQAAAARAQAKGQSTAIPPQPRSPSDHQVNPEGSDPSPVDRTIAADANGKVVPVAEQNAEPEVKSEVIDVQAEESVEGVAEQEQVEGEQAQNVAAPASSSAPSDADALAGAANCDAAGQTQQSVDMHAVEAFLRKFATRLPHILKTEDGGNGPVSQAPVPQPSVTEPNVDNGA